LAAIAFAAIGSLVVLAQAPQQQAPAGQAPAAGAQQPPGGRQGRGGGGAANPTSFFVTSVGKGDGANYGGLAGADAYCADRAKAANIPTPQGRTWRAYLSATPQGGQPAINARDRIGAGPWHNARGALIANNVADLHGDIERDRNQINKQNALSEAAMPINGVGDTPNQHDIITGSNSDGTLAVNPAGDSTCANYTAATDGAGSAQLGHVDRMGRGATGSSWNNAHPSRGCSQANLVATGGNGYLYCFAAN
jgi:hypothetical protein